MPIVVAACRLVVLSFICDLSLLKRRVFFDSVSPRHVVMPAVRPCSNRSVLAVSSSFASARLRLSAHRAASSDAPPPRPAYHVEGRGGDVVWRVCVIWVHAVLYARRSCYISNAFVIYRAFLLYVSYPCYINPFRVILFCKNNAIMGGCV